MKVFWHSTIIGTNTFLFLASFEGILRLGTQIMAFSVALISLRVLIYKEKDILNKIIGRKVEQKEADKQGGFSAPNDVKKSDSL